ncbi:MAG: phosphate acyltransferase PlsX [Candidatus Izimaplasma sp.]|nr:phosphate acyltransferase PlsX [Candidatus Izimaplasma bacterium]
MIKIAIDAMGGDYAPKEQVLGAMEAIDKIDDIQLILYGKEEEINKYLKPNSRIKVVNANHVIPMDEKNPIGAIRRHKDASMVMALDSVSNGENDAIVSSGATQALIAGAHIVIRRMKGFKRTAIAPVIPTVDNRSVILLDTGANLQIRPEHMLQQAYFATIYANKVLEIKNPRVGLINIGTEKGKGRELDQEVYELFLKTDLFEFSGNIEPKTILEPDCDILISDGFTANIVMKTIEGTAKGMGKILKNSLMSSFSGKLAGLLAKKNLIKFKKQMSAEEIGGAVIYGLQKPVIKAQGASKAYGFYNGIRQAANIVRNQVFETVEEYIKSESSGENE